MYYVYIYMYVYNRLITSAGTDSVDLKYYIPDPQIKYEGEPFWERQLIRV